MEKSEDAPVRTARAGRSPPLALDAALPAIHAPDPPGPDATFAGVLLLMVDLEALAERTLLLSPTKHGIAPMSIWAMDADGTLLLQSEHPEMVSKNIRTRSAECNQCHVSFDYAERMLTAKQGTADYQLKDAPARSRPSRP